MAKKIKMYTGEYVIVDDDNFVWLNKFKWHLHTGYPATKIKGKTIFMHRLVNNTPEKTITDHINRNSLDNRRKNLRNANKKTNGINRGKQTNNKSGYKNVYFHQASGLWTVEVRFNGKRVVKYFDSEKLAVQQSEKIRRIVYGY